MLHSIVSSYLRSCNSKKFWKKSLKFAKHKHMRDEICMYAQLSLQWASLTYFKNWFYPLDAGKYNVVIHY